MDKILEELWYGNIDPMEAVALSNMTANDIKRLVIKSVISLNGKKNKKSSKPQ